MGTYDIPEPKHHHETVAPTLNTPPLPNLGSRQSWKSFLAHLFSASRLMLQGGDANTDETDPDPV